MEYLQEHGEATTKELSEEYDFSKSSALKKLKSFEKSGLVDKKVPDSYNEPHLFVITEKGEKKDTSSMGGMVV